MYKTVLTELKGKIDKFTIVVEDFYTPLSVIGGATRQKLRNLKI